MNSWRSLVIVVALAVVSPSSAAGKSGVAGGGSSLEPLPASEFSFDDARHLLIRAGFGGTNEEVQRLHRLGLEGMVNWLVDYEGRPDVVGPLDMSPLPRPDPMAFRRMDEQERRAYRRQRRRQDGQAFGRLRGWWADRMVRSRRPLEERMTLFWHGHFTSSYRDVRNAFHMYLQNELLREHATGNFRELLHAISRDPAMLEYLDNNRNRKGRANENFAREVMELFTLGEGNYSEKDIKEAARAFTGWTFGRFGNQFVFNRRQHDFGPKTVLGQEGQLDGTDVLEILLEQPVCAEYICGKIFSYFVHEKPEQETVQELAREFRNTGYELKPLLRRIFMSKLFYSEEAKGRQVKSPVVLLVSTLRMLGLEPPRGMALVQLAGRLGQDLMMPPNVKGWQAGRSWITTATLLNRYNFGGAIIKAGLRGPRVDVQPMDRAARRRGGRRNQNLMRGWDSGLSMVALVEVIAPRSAEELVGGLCERFLFVPLSPERTRTLTEFAGEDSDPGDLRGPAAELKLRKLLHLLMSTPEFQMC